MKTIFFCLCLIVGASLASCQCLHPPCPENADGVPHDQTSGCCSGTKESLAEIHQQVTGLSERISQFREFVARDMQVLHQNQMTVMGRMLDGEPPSPQSHSGRRHGRPPHRHRHHHHHSNVGPDVTLVPRAFRRPPTVRNPEDFDFAVCHMTPNSALPDSRVQGIVYFSQKKNSDTLYMHLLLRGFNTSASGHEEHPAPPAGHDGQSHQQEERVSGHGVHVHETLDFSRGCDSAGPRFNPSNVTHGGHNSQIRDVSDFGDVDSDSEGAVNELLSDEVASLRGQHSITGKTLMVHANAGVGHAEPSAGAIPHGDRLACCVIERVPLTSGQQQVQVPESPDSENELQRPNRR